jgi:hypothetical protein
LSPSSCAFFSDITIAAAAPSLVCEELPAVATPSVETAGFSLPRASSDVSARGPSSLLKVFFTRFGFPLNTVLSTSIGTISSSKWPAACALIAF